MPALLRQVDWFSGIAEFDPKSGKALPQSLSAVLAKMARYAPPTAGQLIRDRLWRVTDHSRIAVECLMRALNESPRREHALLPVHAVRELDANSFIKLSNRPGRNIREKLAGKPYLQAVRRFQSVNLPENRLLKAFVMRLAELLELRRDCLGQEDELLPKIQSWLRSDEAKEIARWDNLPPNNTLLSHRDYRRVWDAWRWLQTLDDDITRDLSKLDVREAEMRTWNRCAQMWTDGGHRFADMPLLFDYEKLEIRPWFPGSRIDFRPAARRLDRSDRNFSSKGISSSACVDLTTLRPCYATLTESRSLPDAFLWQHWTSEDETVDIELFNSDAVHVHPAATTISSPDLFFSKDNTSEPFDRAARAFASRLRSVFRHDELVWLVPDALNDFELDVVRRNLNARFPGAEPLPRSVAAAVEWVDHSKINDGFPIVVVDTIGGKTCVTKLLAKFDPEIKDCLPETGGFYWERHPPIVIAGTDPQEIQETGRDIVAVDAQGQWHHAIPPRSPQPPDVSTLRRDSRIGHFDFAIHLTESPVAGGIRLHDLQQRAGDIPLWRDQIPELSIKVMQNGIRQPFHLVSRGTIVKPFRGRPVFINVNRDFKLPAGSPFYQFPLFLGEHAENLGFSARLESPAFPLMDDVVCRLDLTFEYGSDEPYQLVFTPLDKSFQSIRAFWQRTEETIVTDASSPEYPAQMSWDELQHWTDAQGNSIDLLYWLTESLSRLHGLIPVRSEIVISSPWRRKVNPAGEEYWFSFADTESGEPCYCSTKNFAVYSDEFPGDGFQVGARLFCRIKKTGNGLSAFDISIEKDIKLSDESRKRIISFRERSLKNRMSLIWGDARSLGNPACPEQFRINFNQLIATLLEDLPNEVRNKKTMFLLACMHKDAPNECVQWIREQVESRNIRDAQAVGLSLGDVSMPWQAHVLSELMQQPTNSVLRVLAYAIWRDRNFVEQFDLVTLGSILNGLSDMIHQIRPCPPRKSEGDKKTVPDWVRATTEPLELLLGLLRIRTSSNPEIKVLLQPNQNITKELAKQIERVIEVVAQSKVTLFSRVQINLEKPEGDRTPNLLFALRLYLTGDDGANAIHITGVSDGDDN